VSRLPGSHLETLCWLVSNGEPVLVRDAALEAVGSANGEPSTLPHGIGGLLSVIAAPVVLDGRIIGVLTAHWPAVGTAPGGN
jgi:GAF domain-containing protein